MRALDLCAGAGGLSLGLLRAGFDVLGIELDADAIDTHRRHVGPCEAADLRTYHPDEQRDLTAGGVPCQPFSAAGLGLGLDDPRYLVPDFLRIAREAGSRAVMLENVRCNVGEKKNKDELGQAYAKLCDVFVNDAFGTAHRAEASTHAVAKFAPVACAGVLLAAELDALGKALAQPARPLVAIVAGSKVSTKLTILESLADKVDQLIVGGGIANTFLQAEGKQIGKSLAEPELLDEAKKVISKLRARGGDVPLPSDAVCATEFAATAVATTKAIDTVGAEDMILDIGPQSAQQLAEILAKAGTIVWNGPVGVFEFDQFGNGTKTLAEAIAASPAFSIAGGGDTLAAIAKYNITDKIGYISTGGGAFLEFLEGKVLPAVEILETRAAN